MGCGGSVQGSADQPKSQPKNQPKGQPSAAGASVKEPQQGCVPCARDGCVYKRTWHQTHCCDACKNHGTHGPKCEKQVDPSAQAALDAKKTAAETRSKAVYESLKAWTPAPGKAAGRKLNVVCLHGITMNGNAMKGMSKPLWSQCQDIADFYFPSAPHPIDANHSFCKKKSQKPGPDAKTWTLDGGKGRDDFAEHLCSFVEKEVPGPVDVLLGYSQGGFSIHQLLQVASLPEKLHAVRAVVILMSGGACNRTPPTKLRSLHIMGLEDKIVATSTSENSASKYVDPVVAKFKGVGHGGPFKPECVITTLEFMKGVHDFHSSFPRLCDVESE